MADDLKSLLLSISDRLANIEAKIGLETPSSSAGAGAGAVAELPRGIRGFDAYFAATVEPFVAAAQKLGGDAALYGEAIKKAWLEKRAFLLMAANCKEPPQAIIMQKLSGVIASMKEVASIIKKNEFEKHGKTVSEGVQALNWLVVKPAPRDFIESYIGGSDYWANGIRKEYRATNPDHVAFVDTFKAILLGLMDYVKEFHTTGVTWNPKGGDVAEYDPAAAAAGTASTGTAAAPVAAAATPAAATATKAAPAIGGGDVKAGLFAALAQGGSVTAGLKTVTKDQQTWRAEFKGGDAPAPAVVKPAVSKRPVETVKGTPKVEFISHQSKWLVQYQSASDGEVVVTINDKKESVYVLGCIGANIRIEGKCNGVVVDSCKKTNVSFGIVMASCELVNCQRMHITCTEKVSSVAIDKTDGVVVTLPKSSMDSEILSAKSSEMNVQWYDDEGELIERPIPEQYVHRIKDGAITADVSDLYH